MTATLQMLLLSFILTQSQSQPSKVCFIGDNLYGSVVKPFPSSQDPRTLMGTFTAITPTNTQSALSVDFASAIYKHTNYKESVSNYIFKITNVGWVLAANASPNTVTIDDDKIKLTCFEDDILDCLKYRWFWGYNSVQFPILPVAIASGHCNTNMCLDNFEMTIETTNNNILTVNKYILDGFMRSVSPTAPCSLDSSVCNSNRTYWINQDDPSYRWYYRIANNANWVYGKAGSDRIACAPGYVESPLFCNTFVYASDAFGGNYTNYTFTQGVCDPTASPTTSPTVSPTIQPSITPTAAPTDVPYCDREYIFDAVQENSSVAMDCPFGWTGNSSVRRCEMGGIWTTVSDDCHLISLTDDFSYVRDELWMGNKSDLQSYTAFTYPLRIDFAGFAAESNCGGWNIELMSGVNGAWNCSQEILSVRNISERQSGVITASGNTYYIDGYMLYRSGFNGDVTASLRHGNGLLLSVIDPEWLGTPSQLLLSSFTNDSNAFTFTYVSLTTFIDWFNPPQGGVNEFSSLWTTTSGAVIFGQYASTSFMDIDPDTNRNYVELSNGGGISSDETRFQFLSPFIMTMIFNTKSMNNDSIYTDASIEITTSTVKRSLFPPFDGNTYPSITIAFRIDNNNLYITMDGTQYSAISADCNNETELLSKISVNKYNVSISIYDSQMNECGMLSHANMTHLSATSLNWNALSIKATTNTDIACISYVSVIAGIEEEIITPSPSTAPTLIPTYGPTTAIPTYSPSHVPTVVIYQDPSFNPTNAPTPQQTPSPTRSPTEKCLTCGDGGTADANCIKATFVFLFVCFFLIFVL